MKKTLLIVIIIVALIIALPVINLIRWTFQEKKPLDIILVDKTVPDVEREKHKSFNWILTNERFVKKENRKSYSYKKDYFGFIPIKHLRTKTYEKNYYRVTQVLDLADNNDAIYVADTYGVSFNDWYVNLNKSRRSRMLDGALNNNDNLLIAEMRNRDKLIILEYNTFDFPTAELEAWKTQERLGIQYSGWTGKYFSSLDTTSPDFPVWMTAMYRKQYRKPWLFTNPGVVILNEKDIIVLEEGNELVNGIPRILTDSVYCEKYGVASSVAFDKWFNIIEPINNNVISEFVIETTTSGDSLLLDNYLSNIFPAVIQDPGTNRMYYFSGDFATGDTPIWTSRFKGIDKLKGILYSDKPEDFRRFFWLYYKPLINSIFTDYYNSIQME